VAWSALGANQKYGKPGNMSHIITVVVLGRRVHRCTHGSNVIWVHCSLSRRSGIIPIMAGSGWFRCWWCSRWTSSGRSSWEAGLTAEQKPILDKPPPQQHSRGSFSKRKVSRWSLGRSAESWKDLPPQHVRTYVIHANLADIPREWWATRKQAMQKKYDCKISYKKAPHADCRKARHRENDVEALSRLTIRGIEALHCSEELLDALCTEHPQVMKPWDCEAVPLRGEAEEMQEQEHSPLQGVVFKFGGCRVSANNKWCHDAATVKVGTTVVDPQQAEPSKNIVRLLPRATVDSSRNTRPRQA